MCVAAVLKPSNTSNDSAVIRKFLMTAQSLEFFKSSKTTPQKYSKKKKPNDCGVIGRGDLLYNNKKKHKSLGPSNDSGVIRKNRVLITQCFVLLYSKKYLRRCFRLLFTTGSFFFFFFFTSCYYYF